MVISKEIELGGRTLRIETGKLAKQAGGSALVQYGDTVVLCTAVSAEEEREGIDFFPLQVEYRERASAVGKIPGGFFKREGKPSEKEILSSRLIDRPIRPLFPENFKYETQVICGVYSSDKENDADVLGAVGASAALMISDIPFDGPIGEVRVGRVNGEFVINPTQTQLISSDMDLIVAGTEDSIVMVEGEGKEVSESDLLAAIKLAHENIKSLCKIQIELRNECGKPKREVKAAEKNEELFNDVKALCYDKLKELDRTVMTKDERHNKNKALYESVQEALKEKYPEMEGKISEIYSDFQYDDMRAMILMKPKDLTAEEQKI